MARTTKAVVVFMILANRPSAVGPVERGRRGTRLRRQEKGEMEARIGPLVPLRPGGPATCPLSAALNSPLRSQFRSWKYSYALSWLTTARLTSALSDRRFCANLPPKRENRAPIPAAGPFHRGRAAA